MLFEDTYFTVEKTSESVYRDRGSRFIGIVIPVKNENDVKEALDKIKKLYYDATHHCYAFRLGFDKNIFRYSDDGEPSGTAGKPILGQIQSKDLTNVLVVVVRYYGGTKLGVSGLIQAYKTTAKEALENNTIVQKTINDVYRIEFSYALMNDVMRILKEEKASFTFHESSSLCVIEFSIRRMFSEKISEKLKNMQGINILYLKTV